MGNGMSMSGETSHPHRRKPAKSVKSMRFGDDKIEALGGYVVAGRLVIRVRCKTAHPALHADDPTALCSTLAAPPPPPAPGLDGR